MPQSSRACHNPRAPTPSSPQVATLPEQVCALEAQLEHETAQHARTAAVLEKLEAELAVVNVAESDADDRATQAQAAAVDAGLLLNKSKDRLLILESQLEGANALHARAATARDEWRQNSERVTRERADDELASEEYAANLQRAEDRLVAAKEKFSLLVRDRRDAEPRLRELEAAAAQTGPLPCSDEPTLGRAGGCSQ